MEDTVMDDWLLFVEATEHDYNCRCDICLKWWVQMGPDLDGSREDALHFGPFTEQEIEAVTSPATMQRWKQDYIEQMTEQ